MFLHAAKVGSTVPQALTAAAAHATGPNWPRRPRARPPGLAGPGLNPDRGTFTRKMRSAPRAHRGAQEGLVASVPGTTSNHERTFLTEYTAYL